MIHPARGSDSLLSQVDQAFENHYRRVSPQEVAEMRRTFQEEGYLKLPSFAPPAMVEAVRQEAHELFGRRAIRRDMKMRVTGNTPRILSNVRCSDITREGSIIPAMYHSQALLRHMSAIFGEECHPCPYENERFMLLSLNRPGDTHGWHWDDYAFSLIWLIESPPPEKGGAVEFIPGTVWNKDDPDNVARYLRERKVERRLHVRDDVYILRGDTCMHRVAPLEKDAFRLVLNLAWASTEDLAKPTSHETLDELYN